MKLLNDFFRLSVAALHGRSVPAAVAAAPTAPAAAPAPATDADAPRREPASFLRTTRRRRLHARH